MRVDEFIYGVRARWAMPPSWMEEAMIRYAAKLWLARERRRLLQLLLERKP